MKIAERTTVQKNITNYTRSSCIFCCQSWRRPPPTRGGEPHGVKWPHGSERPYIGVKGPHGSEKTMKVKGPMKVKGITEVDCKHGGSQKNFSVSQLANLSPAPPFAK